MDRNKTKPTRRGTAAGHVRLDHRDLDWARHDVPVGLRDHASNSNFRDEQTAYYAANAGLEEARDRMRIDAGSGITINASLPTAKPGAANGVLYILNPKSSETVAPWTTTNAYFDDEICKEVSCGGG